MTKGLLMSELDLSALVDLDLDSLTAEELGQVDVSAFSDAMKLEYLRDKFKEKNNPMYAIEAFLFAKDHKAKVPKWVEDWQERAYRDYLDSEGKKEIAKLMGFNRGPGKSQPIKQLMQDINESNLMHVIWVLKDTFEISVEDAAELVYGKESRVHGNCPSVDSLKDNYYRKWAAKFSNQKNMYAGYSKETDRQGLLATFPPDIVKRVLK